VDQGLTDRLKDINSTLASQLNRLRNIQGTVQETEQLAEQARVRVEDTEDLISLASDMLEKAKMAANNVVSVLPRPHMVRRGEGISFLCPLVCFSACSLSHIANLLWKYLLPYPRLWEINKGTSPVSVIDCSLAPAERNQL